MTTFELHYHASIGWSCAIDGQTLACGRRTLAGLLWACWRRWRRLRPAIVIGWGRDGRMVCRRGRAEIARTPTPEDR